MSGHSCDRLRPLEDDVLLARLKALVKAERESTADVVEHLAEVDRRDVVIDKGYPSLFQYCCLELGYSEQAAFSRIRAARASLEIPEIVSKLRAGVLHLDAVLRLSPVLTAENSASVLKKASGASKTEVLKIVAELSPAEARKPDVIRPLAKLPPATNGPELFAQAVLPPPKRIRFEFEADDELVLLVDRLRGLLRHKHPEGRLEQIFKEAAKLLLEELQPKAKRPPRGSALPGRYIPTAVRSAVWDRDGGRCTFTAPDGRRCESRDALEYDHVTPYALGGASNDPANIRLLCRPHNQRLARKRFGPRRKGG